MIVGGHGPKSTKCFSRDRDAELGNISLKESANEIFTALDAVRVGIGKKSPGQASPDP